MTDRNSPEGQMLVNISGVFNDLDDGGKTPEEALDQIRSLMEIRKPLPDKIVLMGTLSFTITIDTRTKDVDEFEVNYDFPIFEQKAEKRLGGDEVDIEPEVLQGLIATATAETSSWPEPERM